MGEPSCTTARKPGPLKIIQYSLVIILVFAFHKEREKPIRLLFVPGSHQNFSIWAVSSQLTDAGRVGECVWMTVNLLMCDIQ
jgi:hypothetical protein